MTFKEFGDVVFYSEDKSAWFVRYTDTEVKRQKAMKVLRYSAGTYGDANKFRNACLAKCVGEEKCGGVVFQYHNSNKATPKKCLFKTLEPTVQSDSKKKKISIDVSVMPEGHLLFHTLTLRTQRNHTKHAISLAMCLEK